MAEDYGSSVLIIDPGHGGEDGGTVSLSGMVESGVNLDIALRLRALARFLGFSTVMTRETEHMDYPLSARTTAARKRWETQKRVELINSIPGGSLISIHQNSYPNPGPWGAQALYGADPGSRRMGERIHANLVQFLNPENRRVASPISRDIYLMAHIHCTAVLVECGFLSNGRESVLLATDSYRLKIATVLAGSYIQFWEDTDEV